MGVRFADHFISFFLNITETKLFHFHRIFKNGGGGGRGGVRANPLNPPLDPPQVHEYFNEKFISSAFLKNIVLGIGCSWLRNKLNLKQSFLSER